MDPIRLGTEPLDDDALVEAFESCRLPASRFHHADHIRLAWVYLGRMSEEEATARIEQAIRRFAAHNGVSEKYHHTITLAWMRLVVGARATQEGASFAEFAAMHPQLLDVHRMKCYYSPERLASPEARAGWIEPDITALP